MIAVLKFSPPKKFIPHLQMLIAASLAASFVISEYLLKTNPAASFFLLPSRAWELGVGAMLATTPTDTTGVLRPALSRLSAILGVILIGIAIVFFDAATPFPGLRALVPVAGSALLILAGIGASRNLVSRALSWKPLVTIGLLSYSWYLWHWPLLSIARNRRLSEENRAEDCAIALVALACAAATSRFVEAPIRRRITVNVSRRKVLFAGAVTLIVLLMAARAVGTWEHYGPQSPYFAMEASERSSDWSVCGVFIFKGHWDGKIFRPDCTQVPTAVGSNPLIVLWGDSHAESWASGIRMLASSDAVELREVSFLGCPPLLRAPTQSFSPRDCGFPQAKIIESLNEVRRTDSRRKIGVILTARWPGYLGTLPIPLTDRPPGYPGYYSDQKTGGMAENLEILRIELRRTLAALTTLNMRVLILLDGPEFRFAPTRCADMRGESACGELLQDVEVYRKPAVEVVERVASEFAEVRVVDPLPFFCEGTTCPAFMNGHPVTWDASHISVSSSKAFAPSIQQKFRWLVAKE